MATAAQHRNLRIPISPTRAGWFTLTMSTRSRSTLPFLPEIYETIDCNNKDQAQQAETSAADVDVVVGTTSRSSGGYGPPTPLRIANRIRRWHVTFGNPALGTYAGSIATLHPRSRRRQRLLLGDDYQSSDDDSDADVEQHDDEDDDSSESSEESFTSCSSVGSLLQCGDGVTDLDMNRTQRIAVMVNVPPHQVPDGVLNLVRSHRPFIEHIRIVIGSSRVEEAEQHRRRIERRTERDRYNEKESHAPSRRIRSQTWACENDGMDNVSLDQLTTSLDATSISKYDIADNVQSNESGTRGSRSTSWDISAHFPYDTIIEGQRYGIDRTTGCEEEKDTTEDHTTGDEDKKYHILFVLDSEDSAETFVDNLHYEPYTSLDESETCSVYHAGWVKGEDGVSLLGPFFASSSTTTAPSSPNDNVSPSTKDEHQCPVCLDKMSIPSHPSLTTTATTAADSSSSILTTVCNHSFHIDCLARWQDSPCPVCRYDHSGLNETLSRCHVCATTVRNYVCLM